MHDDDEERADYPTLIRDEMALQGVKATTANITALADACEAERADFGSLGIMALVLGYRIGRRA